MKIHLKNKMKYFFGLLLACNIGCSNSYKGEKGFKLAQKKYKGNAISRENLKIFASNTLNHLKNFVNDKNNAPFFELEEAESKIYDPDTSSIKETEQNLAKEIISKCLNTGKEFTISKDLYERCYIHSIGVFDKNKGNEAKETYTLNRSASLCKVNKRDTDGFELDNLILKKFKNTEHEAKYMQEASDSVESAILADNERRINDTASAINNVFGIASNLKIWNPLNKLFFIYNISTFVKKVRLRKQLIEERNVYTTEDKYLWDRPTWKELKKIIFDNIAPAQNLWERVKSFYNCTLKYRKYFDY